MTLLNADDEVTEALKKMVKDEQASKRRTMTANVDAETAYLFDRLKEKFPTITVGRILTATIRHLAGVGTKPAPMMKDVINNVKRSAAMGRTKVQKTCPKCGRPDGDCAHTSKE